MGELIDADLEHLRLLKIGYYILAALTGGLSAIAVIYMILGGVFVAGMIPLKQASGDVDPRMFGWIFVAIGCLFLFIGMAGAFLTWFTGKSIGEHKRYTFCMVVAALCCLQFPFGTAIGVCTLMVLTRPTVKALFQGPPPVPPQFPGPAIVP